MTDTSMPYEMRFPELVEEAYQKVWRELKEEDGR